MKILNNETESNERTYLLNEQHKVSYPLDITFPLTKTYDEVKREKYGKKVNKVKGSKKSKTLTISGLTSVLHLHCRIFFVVQKIFWEIRYVECMLNAHLFERLWWDDNSEEFFAFYTWVENGIHSLQRTRLKAFSKYSWTYISHTPSSLSQNAFACLRKSEKFMKSSCSCCVKYLFIKIDAKSKWSASKLNI